MKIRRIDFSTHDARRELTASSPYEEIICDDENVLRNEAIAHRGDPRNEASADGGEHETDAANASRFDETCYRHSGRSMASGERSAPARDGTDGTFEANIDIDRLRMELEMQTPFQAQGPGKPSERARREEEEAEAALHARSGLELEMQTPFRANTPGKPSERDRREMEEAVAAYHFAVRRAAERGRRTSDAEGKENGAHESTDLDTS